MAAARMSPETRAMVAWAAAIRRRERARRDLQRARSDADRVRAAARLRAAEAKLAESRAMARSRVSA